MKEIRDWLKSHSPIFGIDVSILDVKPLKSGQYNVNYLIVTSNKRYVLRLNIAPQSGLKNQIEYEFKTLKFLEPFHITPKVHFYSMDASHFGHPFLIMDFIEGMPLSNTDSDISEVARSLFVLHSIKIPKGLGFMIRNSISEDLKVLFDLLEKYSSYKGANNIIIDSIAKRLSSVKKINFIQTRSLVHTDTVPSNFMVNDSCFIIDWEKARVDDPSYDIAVLFCRFMYWDWGISLTRDQKDVFIKNYPGFKFDRQLLDKVMYRVNLLDILGVLWAALRLIEVESGTVDERVASDPIRYKNTIEYILQMKVFM